MHARTNAPQRRVRVAADLFRDAGQTEFMIATVPTVLGVNESGSLARALKEDRIPCKRIVVNQVCEKNPRVAAAFVLCVPLALSWLRSRRLSGGSVCSRRGGRWQGSG